MLVEGNVGSKRPAECLRAWLPDVVVPLVEENVGVIGDGPAGGTGLVADRESDSPSVMLLGETAPDTDRAAVTAVVESVGRG